MQRLAASRRNSGTVALAFVAALALAACATAPRPDAEPVALAERGPVVAQDDDLAIVIANAGDSAETLARRYLGDARKAWWIAEANGDGEVRPGQVVAIPLKIRNRIGVYADGYQAVPILCYHRFGAKASKLTVTPAAFAAQMGYLAKNGYDAQQTGEPEDPNRPDNLFEPVPGDQAARGPFDDQAKPRSLELWARTRLPALLEKGRNHE